MSILAALPEEKAQTAAVRPRPRTSIPSVTVLGLILLAGFGLRVFFLSQQSLWLDEAYSVFYARQGLAGIAGQQQADPLPYFVALWGWIQGAGEGEYAVRYLSVLFGVLTIPLLYKLVRAAGGPRGAALVGAGVLALSAFHIYYSQEARLHILAGLLAALIGWTLLRAVQTNRPARWWAYTLAATAGIYSYYYLLLLIAGLNLPLLGREGRNPRWWLANGAALVASLPGLVFAYLKLTAFKEPYVPTGGGSLLATVALTPGFIFLGPSIDRWWTIATAVLALLATLVAVRLITASGKQGPRLLAGGLAVSALGIVVLPLLLGVFFNPRYAIIALPLVVALLAWTWWMYARPRRWLAAISAVCLAVPTAVALYDSHTVPTLQRDDNRAAFEVLRNQAQPDEMLIYDLPIQYVVVDYYGRHLGIPTQALPLPKNPSLPKDRQFAAESSDRPATERRLTQLAGQYSGFWLLLSGDPVHWTEDWLDANRLPVGDQWFGLNVRLKHYRPLPASNSTLNGGLRVGHAFGPLHLAQVKPGLLQPGQLWTLELLWQVDSAPASDYTVSVQLFDATGRRVAQHDGPPLWGGLPTTRWDPQHVYPDGVPLRVAPNTRGPYSLEVAVYAGNQMAGPQQEVARLPGPLQRQIPEQARADAGWTIDWVQLGDDGAGHTVVGLSGTVQRQPAAAYTWFVHALDAAGHLVSQDDHPPLTPMPSWQPGDGLADAFVLPANPAAASLEIGAYDAAGKRASFNLPDGSTADHLTVALQAP
ncbi:MAG TPA: glycosyltransferase family 39 protein [Chloroflexota bacterium]|nr:glycosyltransferase family 39 protein [Chloroflexota bacterium]